jgi:YD repeat-containing protein
MGNVINLNRFRKRAEREVSAKQADANRTRFGRTKAERSVEQTRADQAKSHLDQHRIEREDQP